MEREELVRRLQDLQERCNRMGILTATAFLTGAEQAEAEQFLRRAPFCHVFYGGYPDAERRVLFFLPEYLEQTAVREELCAVRFRAYRQGPEHRDYLGAMLASGVRREWLGDILISGEEAYAFCLPTVAAHLAALDRIGRYPVKADAISLDEVKIPERQRKELCFTVQSLRLDAVAGNLFGISRTLAAKAILAGAAKVNDLPCIKPDAELREGDVISLRGYGKGKLAELGGTSRKGRRFLRAELYR